MAGLSTFDMCWAFTSNLEGVKTLFFNLGLVDDKKEKEMQLKIVDNPTIPAKHEAIPTPRIRNVVNVSRTLPAYGSKRVEELALVRRTSRLPFRRNCFRKEKPKKENAGKSKTLPRNLGAEAKKIFSVPKSILKKPSTSGDHAFAAEPSWSVVEKSEKTTEEESNRNANAEGVAISMPNKMVFLRIDDLHIFRSGETRELVSNPSNISL